MALRWIANEAPISQRTLGLRPAQQVFDTAGLDPVAAQLAYRQWVSDAQDEQAPQPSPAMLRAASVWKRAHEVALAVSGSIGADQGRAQILASSEIS
ncbi:hypothetical protein GCM10007320_54160 [Pseudorhodoferax aquiterrae]|uniref:Uncharacterized protein n=1 Tax=Pseudorhodoferax aquiterrae TaxID=747304 RepID=A0ABQ3GA70_9BURK|nr:hypothetical protein [Pseudorhodoferax aquiterrae]GHC98447.1 hypothetical protein GCM10007320_54160 [Pseudorhodoferax aquiterrae]